MSSSKKSISNNKLYGRKNNFEYETGYLFATNRTSIQNQDKKFFVHDKLDIIEFHTNILAQFPVFYLGENQMYNSIAEIDDYDL